MTRGWHEFAGVLAVKGGAHHEFLKNQTDIAYKHLDIIDQLEKDALSYKISKAQLSEWELRLDIPLWHLVVADRNLGHMFVQGGLFPRSDIMKFTTHENISRYVCFFLDYFTHRLEAYQPDAVFFLTAIAAMPPLALAKVCQWMQIPFYGLRSTRIRDRYVITRDDPLENFSVVEERYRRSLFNQENAIQFADGINSYFESFQYGKPSLPEYTINQMRKQSNIKQESFFHFWAKLFRSLLGAFYRWVIRLLAPDHYLRFKSPFSYWWLKTREYLTKRYQDTNHMVVSTIENEPYILYALHVNPEASTMVQAPNFVNQLLIIEALSKNIPITHKLYVKEHPIMGGRRPIGFYKEINRFPNVRLLKANEDNYSLIRNADLVAVITGTTGWEAIMMGRPVITFGECFYVNLGFSERCSDFNQLGQLIHRLLYDRDRPNPKTREKRIKLFLAALYELSFPLSDKALWPSKPLQPGGLGQTEQITARVIAEQLASAIGADIRS